MSNVTFLEVTPTTKTTWVIPKELYKAMMDYKSVNPWVTVEDMYNASSVNIRNMISRTQEPHIPKGVRGKTINKTINKMIIQEI